MVKASQVTSLQKIFGERIRHDSQLARYTSARVGGTAEYLLELTSLQELSIAIDTLWQQDLPFVILGGGSNVLISDQGLSCVVLINKARKIKFAEISEPPTVWAESGANLGRIARQAAELGLSGLEWAGGIPGTLGGAMVGNAGAHGEDMRSNLIKAQILSRHAHENEQTSSIETWSAKQFGYGYRSSTLKNQTGSRQFSQDAPRQHIILSATLRLERSTPGAVSQKMDEYNTYRRRTQPPGASMGSMFKNPPGDYAGRLIDAVGMKGTQVGGAQISTLHANFFVNLGDATASDILTLIRLAQQRVEQEFGLQLELEIELLGEHES